MCRRKTLLFFACFTQFFVFGQKSYNIVRISEEPKIDGVLNDAAWILGQKADSFKVNYPKFGDVSQFKSEMFLTYNDNFLFVGGRLLDPRPDSVMRVLSSRDDVGNADWAGVIIDPFGQGINGFCFEVTATGVEIDGLINADNIDFNWNAVWTSKVIKTNEGWNFEMKIPFAAIRFPKIDIQNWNINFIRNVRRAREQSYFNPVDPEKYGELAQSAKATGISNIKSPLRLALYPYLSTYAINSFNPETKKQEWGTRTTGGMDLKYGLTESFTLDVSLIPDFGQTVSDQTVLNLGPFEVKYNENRAFFNEGIDLFQTSDIFYSRRIGSGPYNEFAAFDSLKTNEKLKVNPSQAPLLNATKMSGRTKNGLGIGIFNAVVGRTFAQIEDTILRTERKLQTNPLTNYNVFVLSQSMPNNGVLSFINTHVFREGNQSDANVASVTSNLYSKDMMYGTFANIKLSAVGSTRPELGHSLEIGGGKAIGKYTFFSSYSELSDKYDPNDLGYLENNNDRTFYGESTYNFYQPKGRFLRRNINANFYYSQLYKPTLYASSGFEFGMGGTTRNFLTTGFGGGFNPAGWNHFESRTFGTAIRTPSTLSLRAYYSSDYAKPFALDFNVRVEKATSLGRDNWNASLSPRFRISNNCFLVYRSDISVNYNDYGFVNPFILTVEKITIGVRDRIDLTNSLKLNYIFTNRMGLNVNFRHYWSQIKYKSFNGIDDDGNLFISTYNGTDGYGKRHDVSFNAFTIDLNYSWVFFPGSTLSLAWKNNIFSSKQNLDKTYFKTFDTLFDQPQINSLSMKLIVFVDALWANRLRKKP